MLVCILYAIPTVDGGCIATLTNSTGHAINTSL